MFGSSSQPEIEFLPDDDGRAWVADTLQSVVARVGPGATKPHLFSRAKPPRDPDDLFEMMCDVQGQVGQGDVDFGLVDMVDKAPEVPPGFVPLGNPAGQLMHTFRRNDEFVTVVAPTIFRKAELLFAGAARELGRIALAIGGGHHLEPHEYEAEAEIAAITLGMGVWVANGSYVFQNSCCGGGCGIDFRSLRTGLSMPEACFATALDGHRKGLSRRSIAKHLESNQKAALKRSWSFVGKTPELKALGSGAAVGALA
ncbi:MAG: hypothetical protein ACE37F_29665 [Nannocystaceae bacterium]|nr:hypothetical protein [bacterium]